MIEFSQAGVLSSNGTKFSQAWRPIYQWELIQPNSPFAQMGFKDPTGPKPCGTAALCRNICLRLQFLWPKPEKLK